MENQSSTNSIEYIDKKTDELNLKIQNLLDVYNSEVDSSKYEFKIESKHKNYAIVMVNRGNLTDEEKDQLRDHKIHLSKV